MVCFSSSLLSTSVPSNEPVENVKKTVPPSPEILVLAKQLSLKAVKFQSELTKQLDTSDLETLIEEINKQLQEIDLQSDLSTNQEGGAYEKLFILRGDLKSQRVLIDQYLAPLYEALEDLYNKGLFWKEENKKWEDWYSLLLEQDVASSLREEMRSTIEVIRQIVKTMNEKSNVLIEKILKANETQSAIFKIENQIEQKLNSKDSVLISGNSLPLFSRDFFIQFKSDLQKQVDAEERVVELQNIPHSKGSEDFIFLKFLLVLLIAGALVYARKTFIHSKQVSFMSRPFATGFLVSFILLKTIEPVLSPGWILAERLMLWIAFLRLISLYFTNKSVLSFLYVLAGTHILLLLFNVFSFPRTFTRLIMFLGSLTVSGVLALTGYSFHKNKDRFNAFLLFGVSAVFASVSVLELFGFANPAHTVFWITFGTLGVFAIALLFYLMAKEITDWLVRNVNNNGNYFSEDKHEAAIQFIHFVLFLFVVFCTVIYLLVAWGVYDTPGIAFKSVLTSSLQLGNLKLSISDVATACVLGIGTILASGLVQSTLVSSVFPSMKIPKEVGFSIARLVHYVLLVVGGFLILLSLGVSLTNIAIFSGAIGVGLGLGLQEIVKNFAAGIIILLERPIKIGDLIEFDARPCRVEKIGLRSTLVRSVDGILKVIPNNDLIVNSVTNWTHSRKQLRLSSKIGVAYGSDVDQVMKLLKEAAEEHEQVLKYPEVRVLFREFGDSALNFEIRYWVTDAAYRVIVPSEVNQRIEKKLSQAGIQIPFPQMDVHLFRDTP